MDKISVILPIYKVEEYIRECMSSLLNQTYQNIEIILVDDGSPDNSGEICDEYAKKDDRVTVIHKENAGAPAARNAGFAVATGEWIAYVDPDDWIELNTFKEVMEVANSKDPDIVIFNAFVNNGDRQTEKHSFSENFTTEDKNIIKKLQLAALDKQYSPLQDWGQSYPWDKIYKKSLLAENNIIWPENLKANDDIIYVLYAFQFAHKVSYIDKAFYHYRINQDTITTKYTANRVQIDHDIFMEMLKIRDMFDLGEEYNAAFYARVIRNTWLCCGREFFNPDNEKSFSGKLNSISEMLHDDIIITAFHKVDRSKLETVARVLTMFKNPKPIWFFVVYRAYTFRHRHKS